MLNDPNDMEAIGEDPSSGKPLSNQLAIGGKKDRYKQPLPSLELLGCLERPESQSDYCFRAHQRLADS